MNDEKNQTILVIYEMAHVAELSNMLAQCVDGQLLVIVLDREIEFELERRDIPFRSGREYQSKSTYKQVLLAEEWARGIFDAPEWAFFEYRAVPFREVFFSVFQVHIQRILYFTEIFANIIEAHSPKRLMVPRSLQVISHTSGYLLQRDLDLPAACAMVCAEKFGVQISIPLQSHTAPLMRRISERLFSVKRVLFSLLLSVWNSGIATLQSEKHPRILVSDYWRNLAPIFSQLSSGEIVLVDRSELFHINFRDMWRFRMRFFHVEDFGNSKQMTDGSTAEATFGSNFERLTSDPVYLSQMKYRGVAPRLLLVGALEDIVKRARSHTRREVDGAYEMLGKIKPDSILLRASASSQTHFAVLAFVGRALGVSSIELQHGLEYLGPGSSSKRHTASLIGVYGPIIQREMEGIGFSLQQLPAIGSPRFDEYARNVPKVQTGSADNGCEILCICPLATFGEFVDSYVVEDYFTAVANALRGIPIRSVVVKLRTGLRQEALYREIIARAFKDIRYRIAQDEPLIDLYTAADAVVSCYSTAVLEGLLCQKPMILFSPMEFEYQELLFHFAPYVKAGAILLAKDEQELKDMLSMMAKDPTFRVAMAEKARIFMKENYTFDGKASERLIKLFEHLKGQSAIV